MAFKWDAFRILIHIHVEDITQSQEDMKVTACSSGMSHERAQWMSETLFLPQERKIHIFEPTCNDFFYTYYILIQKLQKWILDNFMLPSVNLISLLLLVIFQQMFDRVWLPFNTLAWNGVINILTGEDMESIPLYM